MEVWGELCIGAQSHVQVVTDNLSNRDTSRGDAKVSSDLQREFNWMWRAAKI